ncbi:CDP-glycerol glycerophosphotransferase family protein [Paenibacillus aceris]|uniref:CDP-glycerol glycerophosphotransferase (TagB/SpsB family) n=1 Tax=Paenibacillus aceris TaxID=869555 RepID=A0ABS4I811_9BACL|nr:CDP-glycerol glycerophosphotransferase family protein [Paenibacillus aceris]MBP1967064.1 CDP-glycerol glycerophosphotransferase (TagB/SpsB family) [Paenibacillus aceris]NHW33261.1 teichoic acid biosynthesis protein B [Paenibacillus aceris]
MMERKLKIRWFLDILKLIGAIMISKILKLKLSNQDIWLISERRGEVRDNGYHLFKYIREKYPFKKVYYVIDFNSDDLRHIEHYGNIIFYDSFKHFVYYVMAKKLVCAHLGSTVPESPICWKAEELGILKKKRAFIQHGITKETLPQLMYPNTKANLFVCGAQPEYHFVSKRFGYPDQAVKYLGLCRFDELHNFSIEKQILLMPTWRQWFGFTPKSGRNEEEIKEFINSDYYKRFQSLLNNKQIDKILKESNVKLVFYPHHEMQGYLNAFSTRSSNIIIANERDYDVQKLLKESALLITDYSSIAFDFAYMRKPVIYYQFDVNMYFEKHYPKGYFEYDRDGFGPTVHKEDELISGIEDLVSRDLSNDQRYLERINLFFPLFDRNNCERNYNLILAM